MRPLNPDCAKCGAAMVGPTYHRAGAFDCATPTEHLHYRCTCGYETTRPVRNALRVIGRVGSAPSEGA